MTLDGISFSAIQSTTNVSATPRPVAHEISPAVMPLTRSLTYPSSSTSHSHSFPTTIFCASCLAAQRREYRIFRVDLGHLKELLEITKKKHAEELRMLRRKRGGLMVKIRQEELEK